MTAQPCRVCGEPTDRRATILLEGARIQYAGDVPLCGDCFAELAADAPAVVDGSPVTPDPQAATPS